VRDPVRILFVNNQYQLGGAETVVDQLRHAFPDSRLVVPAGKGLPADLQMLYPRALSRMYYSRLHRLVDHFAPQSRWTDCAFRKLVKDPADIIHLHNFHGNYASVESLAFLAARKHVIWTFHGLWGVTGGCDHPRGCNRFLHQCGQCPQIGLWPIGSVDRTAESLQEKIQRLSSLSFNVVAPSRYVADTIRQSQVGTGWRVHHIPNGIAAKEWTPIPFSNRKIDLLVVNRDFLDPHKGFSMIRQALRAVSRTKQLRVTFVGRNSRWAADQLPELRCSEAVEYLTDRARMIQLYLHAKLFLFASPDETFPCVILEAMAAGCCIVATPSGGVVEQIRDGETGFLASAVDGGSLASALERALQSGREWPDFGQRARTVVIDHFSESAMVERYRQLYATVAGQA